MHIDALNLRDVIVFLVAAGVVVPLVRRFRVSPVLGFLIIGVVIGPFGLARFADALPWLNYLVIRDLDGVRALAELGIVFLLFMIGLELSVDRLWAMRRLVFGLGGLQVVTTAIVISVIASLFGNTLQVAVILGAGFALSSTAIVIQLLTENRRLGSATGRVSFAILLFQDLAVLPILFLVAAFASASGDSAFLSFAWAMGQAVIAVAVILFFGRLVIRPLFRFIGKTASREMFLALVLLVIAGTALATQGAGLSMALGAFLAGLLMAETEYRHEIEVDIEPFKGLFLGLFFVSVGMSVDVAQIAARPVWLIASVFGLYLIKVPIIYGLARLFRRQHSVAFESAMLLGQGGEFAFLVVGMAASLGLMPRDTAQFMLIVTGLTMLATPAIAYGARKVAQRIEAWEESRGRVGVDLPDDLADHIVIVGYGRVGQMVGSILDEQGLVHIALDSDAGLVARFRAKGAGIFHGDANRSEILSKFGIERATALVITMDNADATERVVTATREKGHNLPIFARARDIDHAMRLIENGADHVVPEIIEVSLQLSEIVLMEAGVPDQAARQMIEARRQLEQAAVDETRRD